ncbi:replication-associated recombination protein A [Halochromatium sp.]
MSRFVNGPTQSHIPLAERMRPRGLDEVVGQSHLLASGRPLREAISADRPHSAIFWGPPGTGKTTLARLIAAVSNSRFLSLSAVLAGVKDIRAAVDEARQVRSVEQRGTILFIDEVHRFNKAQQDAFLPHVEDGTLVFIGATTENPSFALNNALLSRARVYLLKPLEIEDLERLADRALSDAERGLASGHFAARGQGDGESTAGRAPPKASEGGDLDSGDRARGRNRILIDSEARRLLAEAADGDARRLLNLLELAADLAVPINSVESEAELGVNDQAKPIMAAGAGREAKADVQSDPDSIVTSPEHRPEQGAEQRTEHGQGPAHGAGVNRCISIETLRQVIEGSVRRFDKGGDAFYDQISALHKSVRGSAPDAALYWLARMIDGGCDPLYIARRLVRMASEDIGNADPRALDLALNAWEAQQGLGSPEGELALAQATVYLASAAKSNAVYMAWNSALEDVRKQGSLEVPVHLRNAPTRLMKELGYGHAYRYAHDEPDAYAAGERYFPDGMTPRRYYQPVERGLEIRIREKLERLEALDRAARSKPG